eukprot:TRINITY_DN30890_c0_g1_i2.p1 TRINITY_DN30890_c0_g1~~TRINITY_DN30890_c0_g1_i2.p1  ORF type:complete len:158 (+),score=25.66 TRINITY_DN30890_c0_g1_i2:88-561(+)
MGNCCDCCENSTPGDVSGITVSPCDLDGKKYPFEFVGCNACGHHMDTVHFFACKTCTDKKINCVKALEICGPCIHKHTKGHQIFQYVDGVCFGQVDEECIGCPPVAKKPGAHEPAYQKAPATKAGSRPAGMKVVEPAGSHAVLSAQLPAPGPGYAAK